MSFKTLFISLTGLLILTACGNSVVIEDFEKGLDKWTAEGEAFTGTTQGGDVVGFMGTSYLKNADEAAGSLTSAPFTITKPFINLLLGGSRAGGFVDLFGTANADTIHEMLEKGDKKADLVWNTMLYQICKMIGEMSCVLCGKVDGILLTGGLLRFPDVKETIEKRCGWIAPISVYPGEMEQEALALPALKVMQGKLTAQTYSGKDVWQGFEGFEI